MAYTLDGEERPSQGEGSQKHSKQSVSAVWANEQGGSSKCVEESQNKGVIVEKASLGVLHGVRLKVGLMLGTKWHDKNVTCGTAFLWNRKDWNFANTHG